jgi:hypothetical protein
VREEVKCPEPEPLVVCELATVGRESRLQQTPLAVTAELPLQLMVPPEFAPLTVIFVAESVEIQIVQNDIF